MSNTEGSRPKGDVVNPMAQLPLERDQAESPLFHADIRTMAMNTPQVEGVAMAELSLLTHLVLRGSPHNQDFMRGAQDVLGFPLPERLQSQSSGALSARWLGPDEWLIVAPTTQAYSLEMALRAGMTGHIAVTNISGGQTILMLSGDHAVDVLRKSTSYDMSDSHFPVGKVVTTTCAKTQAIIRRVSVNDWELIVRRSFADYLWLWLQDASDEYGLVIYE